VPEQETIAAAIEPVLADMALELYDLELSTSGRTRTLRVLVDREGGVDLDAITEATQRISPVVEAQEKLQGPFTLEVSSPGLERPLRRSDHFRRAVGDTVSVKYRDAAGHVHRLHGRLVAADDDGVTVEADESAERVGYDQITQARTVFEFGPAPKADKSKRAKKSKKKEVAR
jgi:ribosome maturation factor RimP